MDYTYSSALSLTSALDGVGGYGHAPAPLPILCVQFPCIKEYYYTYVINRQMQIDKICFIVYYYLPTCFSRYYDHHQGVM